MTEPVIAHIAPVWRHIGGVDFQQVRPYTLVAAPDRMRPHLWVWLRKDTGVWAVYLAHAGQAIGQPLACDRSAGGAVAVAMAHPQWSATVRRLPHHGRVPVTSPYPDHASSPRSRPGWYADKPTALDSRWDHTRNPQ